MLANMLAMTAALQFPAKVVLGFIDSEVNRLLDLDANREVAFSLVTIGHSNAPAPASPKQAPKLNLPTVPLSGHEIDYPELRDIHAASSLNSYEEVRTWRERVLGQTPNSHANSVSVPERHSNTIERVILRRGSSRKFERVAITKEQLMTILHSSTRGIWPGLPLLNELYLIVNAVEGMEPGAYFYRPGDGSLECLRQGDFRNQARHLGLQQDLPGDAAGDIFFLADLDDILNRMGNRGYRAVQLEAGIIGGKVYLASYALSLGATGLTFFDDDVVDFFSPHATGKSAIFLVAVGKGRKVR